MTLTFPKFPLFSKSETRNAIPALQCRLAHVYQRENTRFSRNSESGIRGAYCYGFNGKDRESEFSSGAYDFGARIHDARLGRWMSVDDLAFKFPNVSPYNFALLNPLRNIDPDGRDIVDIIVNSAKWTNDGSDRVLQVEASAKVKIVIYNNSSCKMDMNILAKTVESKMEKALSNQTAHYSVTDNKDYTTGGYFDKNHSDKQFYINVNIKVDVEVEVVNSLDEIDQNQTVVILTDNIVKTMGASLKDPAGLYYGNGVALLETKNLSETQIVRGVLHEVGHDLGMNDSYTKVNGEVTHSGSGYMGALDTKGEYYSNKALGEFHHSVMQTVWTSLHLNKNRKVHNKTYSSKYSRSEDAKKVAKNGTKS